MFWFVGILVPVVLFGLFILCCYGEFVEGAGVSIILCIVSIAIFIGIGCMEEAEIIKTEDVLIQSVTVDKHKTFKTLVLEDGYTQTFKEANLVNNPVKVERITYKSRFGLTHAKLKYKAELNEGDTE